MERGGAVYILTNKHKTVLYTGVTSDLVARIQQHQDKILPGFTSRYNVTYLVYYELFHSIEEAIIREKQIKGKVRKWKEEIITSFNPSWEDLTEKILSW